MARVQVNYKAGVWTGRSRTFDTSVLRLGRDPSCEVLFDEEHDRAVSRLHAVLRHEAGSWVVYPEPGRLVLRGSSVLRPGTRLRDADVLTLCSPVGPAIELRTLDQTAESIPPPPIAVVPVPPPVWLHPPLPEPAGVEHSPGHRATAAADESTEVVAAQEQVTGRLEQREHLEQEVFQQDPVSSPSGVPLAAGTLPAFSLAADEEASNDPVEPIATVARPRRPTLVTPALPRPPRLRVRLPSPPQNPWIRAILAGTVIATAMAGSGWGAYAWRRAQLQRDAIARVERLRQALERFEPLPTLTPEDLAIFDAAVARNVVAPLPPEIDAQLRRRWGLPLPPSRTAVTTAARPAAPEPDTGASAELNRAITQAQKDHAEWRRLEITLIGRPRGAIAPTAARTLRAAYESDVAQVNKLRPAVSPVDGALALAARALGECDAALPPELMSAASAQLRRWQADSALRESLQKTIDRGSEARLAPTLTAALADQGLPVELYALAIRRSGLDPRRVGPAQEPWGTPRGLWQLLPEPARQAGLRVTNAPGDRFDPDDERHKPEKDARIAARLLRDLIRGPGAGSSLLVMSTWMGGDPHSLREARTRAGITEGTSPAQVSVVGLWQGGGLTQAQKDEAAHLLALTVALTSPAHAGLALPPTLTHVE